jgi:hypothetical protein
MNNLWLGLSLTLRPLGLVLLTPKALIIISLQRKQLLEMWLATPS